VLTMYSTSWCGYCHRLKSQLDREGIAYQVVDIEADEAAASYVMSVNGGNQTVPTLEFADGSALTNPTIIQVKQHLAELAAGDSGDLARHDDPVSAGPNV
jgi:mycoredoxin